MQISQHYGGDDQHMVSRLYFDVYLGGTAYRHVFAEIKQVVGCDFESGTIEVGSPVGYRGPWNVQEFQAAAERYYRKCVGAGGMGIRLGRGAGIVMRNNHFAIRHIEQMDVEERRTGAW
jgi:hypothetical protein